VNEMDPSRFPYKDKVLEVHTNYKNIASVEAADLIRKTPDLVIIDIRSEAEFASRDTLAQNNIGRLKNAINIPQAVFPDKFDSYDISANKPVLLYDLYGHNSMDVIPFLRSKGFTRIYNLYEGLNAFSCDHAVANVRNQLFNNQPAYSLIDPRGTITLLSNQANILVIDTRPKEEFENKAAEPFHNLGRLKTAININTAESLEKLMQEQTKDQPILVYGGMSPGSSYNTCEALSKKGFKNVFLLSQGLYRFVWATANVEDCKSGKALLTNHEGLY